MQHLCIVDQSFAQGVIEPLLQAAPCTLRSLQLCMDWGVHLSGLPQLLTLARVCFPSLVRLELTIAENYHDFGQAAEE